MKESKEAMKLALEFVEYHSKYWNGEGQHPQEIATALREALAEQPAQQEPPVVAELLCVCGAEWERRNRVWVLVATPPARPWVGLTKEEVDSWELPDCPTVFEFVQFIEDKIKDKNT